MNKQKIKKDLIIIGAGPAGLTAAIYSSRSRLDTLVLEDELTGGQIRGSAIVDNYPGFISISGAELADRMYEQAEKSGAKIDEFDKILKVSLSDDEKIIETKEYMYIPETVIISTGSKYRALPIPEEEKFHGKGIHYCELCDGELYQGKDIVVVGGGNSGVEGAIFLTKYANSIKLIHRGAELTAEKSSQEELLKNTKINVIWNSEVIGSVGDSELEAVKIKNIKTGEVSEIKTSGVFVYIGLVPRTDLFKENIDLNKWGYIKAGEDTKTNIKGVFAAGDVREKAFRQLTTAVSDGTNAALMAEKYLFEKRRSKNG